MDFGGRKANKIFFGLEKNNYISKIIKNIEKEDGSKITNQTEILEEVKIFYNTLYKSKHNENTQLNAEFLKDISLPKLATEESVRIEGEITLKEASEVLKHVKNNKSPGTSGFSAEFYKVFWSKLGDFVVRALNEAYKSNSLSVTQTQGLITCIPKGNKPKQFLKNWRPVTLLNTVYKIGTGVIANRFKSVLSNLIHEDQTGFLKGRFIGENIRLIYDILHYTEDRDIPGMLLLIDFEKAFDSLSWSFVDETLTLFNFGPSIKKWFHIFYKDANSAVTQCGFLSDFFKVERGCRQGDPLSCYIFILCAEILSVKIRQNKKIKGIQINETEYKLSQFADDTSIILDGSYQSLNETLNLLEQFSLVSGLKVNFDKTKVVWIGKKKYSSDTIKTRWKLTWMQTQFEMLGIKFDVNLENIIKLNYENKLVEIQSVIKNWNRRILTPLGKITIIKSLLIAKMNNLFLTLPNPPKDFITNLNSMFFNFIWNGNAKIKRSVVVKNYEEGGMGMINLIAFINSLKSTWIRRMIFKHNGWAKIIQLNINKQKLIDSGKQYVKNIINSISNLFWKDTLNTYIDIVDKHKVCKENILQCPIFYNPDITVGNKVLVNNTLYKAGVYCIGDFFNCFGNLLKLEEFNIKFKTRLNYLEYHGITSAIKKCFKNNDIQSSNELRPEKPFCPPLIHYFLKDKKGAKTIYNILNYNEDNATCIRKWTEKLNIRFCKSEWKKVFSFIFKISKDSKIQWFQMRLIHRLLGTNHYLHTIGIKNSALCTFCKSEDETIEHLFWTCPFSKTIFDDLMIKTNILTSMEIKVVLFGLDEKLTAEEHLIILFIKMYIFSCKNKECKPSTQFAKTYIVYQLKCQKEKAIITNSIEYYSKHWEPLILKLGISD